MSFSERASDLYAFADIIPRVALEAALSAEPTDELPSVASERATKIGKALRLAEEYLGNGAKMKTNEAGDAIFLSENGARRIRFDMNRPHPHEYPHAHVDEFINGEWTTKRVWPTDVPQR